MDKLDYDTNLEKCKALAKILKDYEYRKILKEEVFARNVGKSIYDEVLNTFSEKYIDEKDEKMLNSIKAMLEDSNSVNDVIGSLDLEEDMDEAKDLLNSIISDLNTLQDPELINRLCTNFSLSDLPNEDVVEYEEKATRLLAAYFHLLSKEDKEQLIKDALQSGYYRILNVIPERRLVEEASKEDILEFYNSVSQTDFYDNLLNYEKIEILYIFRNMCNEPEKSRQVLDSLMEQNNVNGVSLFFKNYTNEGSKLFEVFSGDLNPLFNWVKNIPEDIKITHHFNEMLDSLKGVIYSADIDNEIQDRAVSFLNSQRIKAKGLNYEQKLLE